jgi:murein DD-endopeptidase MepM/ murein hydrolase activator NlpD
MKLAHTGVGLYLALLACAPAPRAGPAGHTCPEPASPAAGGADRVKDELVRRLNARDGDGVFSLFSEAMKGALPREKTRATVEGILAAKGRIESAERLSGSERRATYRLRAERGEWQLELHVAPDGQILGLKFGEPPPPEPAVEKSAIPLALPFRGRWVVFWGGDTLEQNQHVLHRSQRRAADLVIADDRGKTFRGEGKANADYYAYGQELLAVADGEVVTVIDGVPENAPGAMNPYFAPGNAVILRHTPTLYSVYAHLQPGSPRVRVGQKIRRGEVLGLCGNSGNSSEPHLHFQLQDGPRFEDSWGVEAVFGEAELTRAGQTSRVTAYSFRKGDLVAPAP